MSSNLIDAIIDGKSAYAYAFMTRDRSYGHMVVNIRLGDNCPATIKVNCQIGSPDGGRQNEEPYAIRFGASSNDDCIRTEDLERCLKVMRKIERYLEKVRFLYGNADTYAEYCQRILIGSGVATLIAEPNDGWVNGGLMKDKALIAVGAASQRKLKDMESALIGHFSRKAA